LNKKKVRPLQKSKKQTKQPNRTNVRGSGLNVYFVHKGFGCVRVLANITKLSLIKNFKLIKKKISKTWVVTFERY
jgi:hypothetical protein